MKFLFITSTNLASNPRLHKELDLAVSLGHSCTVLQFELGNWSDEKTKLLELDFPSVNFINFSATRKPFFSWLYASLIEKVYSFIPYYFLSLKYLSYSFSKRTFILVNYLKKMPDKFDWVIAHNPPSFYPAYFYSKYTFSNLGIDIEDYHPGETMKDSSSRRITKIMSIILPHARYCSFASPLIKNEVCRNISSSILIKLVVLNSFKKSDFIFSLPKNKKLSFVWYSQNIDFGRGIELVIPVFNELKNTIQLTLIGNLNPIFYNNVLKDVPVDIISPLTAKELHTYLSSFDIGLALDYGKDFNNQIALSNKIISYAQAGLMIFTFPTTAKISFLKDYNIQYAMSDLSKDSIKNTISNLIVMRDKFSRELQFDNATNFCWEVVSKSLINIWNQG